MLSLAAAEDIWVDVEAFESAAAAARRHGDAGAYRAAIDLYGGDLLPDDLYEDWAVARRESLRAEYGELLAALARIHEGRGEPGAAIEMLRRAVAHEPAHEESHAGLMRLYARAGQRSAALRQYEQLQVVLRRELDAEPDEATRRLHAEILEGTIPSAPSPPPDAGKESRQRHNLPAALTSFVGREAEMAEAERLLRSARLLTITGPGGAGKTRLALELAGRSLGEYRDGAWLVELAPISEDELVPQMVAAAGRARVALLVQPWPFARGPGVAADDAQADHPRSVGGACQRPARSGRPDLCTARVYPCSADHGGGAGHGPGHRQPAARRAVDR